jgi:hypothetical protein
MIADNVQNAIGTSRRTLEVMANIPSSLILVTLMMEALSSTQIPEDDILHSHRHENIKSYIALTA